MRERILALKKGWVITGFGISQVLPVIVNGFMSPVNSITLVEQPEVHLHPRMQAKLADLFVDIVKSGNVNGQASRQYIVETHSEYFLNRLRALIATKKIDSTFVKIYSVEEAGQQGSTINNLAISPNGSFLWPRHFMATDLDNTLLFLEN